MVDNWTQIAKTRTIGRQKMSNYGVSIWKFHFDDCNVIMSYYVICRELMQNSAETDKRYGRIFIHNLFS